MDKTFFERWVEKNHDMLNEKFHNMELVSLVNIRRLLNLLEMAYDAGKKQDETLFDIWVNVNQAALGRKFYELGLFSMVDTRRMLNLLELAYNAGKEQL